jgi:hypothetical protein
MAAAVDAPKIAPEIVAEATLDAVEADQHDARRRAGPPDPRRAIGPAERALPGASPDPRSCGGHRRAG